MIQIVLNAHQGIIVKEQEILFQMVSVRKDSGVLVVLLVLDPTTLAMQCLLAEMLRKNNQYF
jgi:hypothetical protein